MTILHGGNTLLCMLLGVMACPGPKESIRMLGCPCDETGNKLTCVELAVQIGFQDHFAKLFFMCCQLWVDFDN